MEKPGFKNLLCCNGHFLQKKNVMEFESQVFELLTLFFRKFFGFSKTTLYRVQSKQLVARVFPAHEVNRYFFVRKINFFLAKITHFIPHQYSELKNMKLVFPDFAGF